jgi:hypothetical protein
MTVSVVLIPADESAPLKCQDVTWNDGPDGPPSIQSLLLLHDIQDNAANINEFRDLVEIPLLRPLQDTPGLYAYYLYNPNRNKNNDTNDAPNIRATRLAMACGHLSMRLFGNILVTRSHPTKQRWYDLSMDDIFGACEVSPDLRTLSVQKELLAESNRGTSLVDPTTINIPTWLANAAQQNYHDSAAISRMAQVMKNDKIEEEEGSDNSDGQIDDEHDKQPSSSHQASLEAPARALPCEFVAKSPLCLHCRRPTRRLCPDCLGAYFCPPPRDCRNIGWSHSCQCSTWKLYTSRRGELSKFEYLDPGWQSALVGRDFQTSEEPYKLFLAATFGLKFGNIHSDTIYDGPSSSKTSWWRTETDGWAGGQSASARQVDPTIRHSYQEGFAPLSVDQIPKQQRPTDQDYKRAGVQAKNAVGLWILSSWEDYYKLRGVPPSSPVALLCTFPLTIYRAIEQYGEVPVTVARMLKRPLRIHVVGAEKEMNFLDLFQELGFLLPESLSVELVFVVRQDMLPSHCRLAENKSRGNETFSLEVRLTSNLKVHVVSGTYGTTTATSATTSCLDPNFDVGSGPPDVVLALNAGLFAYESWRSVIDYLYHNAGVVGVFTDYNEYSGMNCASLGGAASRESLTINPFRQPLAMPVYSMNLPQFSNGFFYVFNAQELE